MAQLIQKQQNALKGQGQQKWIYIREPDTNQMIELIFVKI